MQGRTGFVRLAKLHRSLVVQGMLAEPAVEVHLPLKRYTHTHILRGTTTNIGSTTDCFSRHHAVQSSQPSAICLQHRTNNRCESVKVPSDGHATALVLLGPSWQNNNPRSGNPSLSIVCTHKEIEISVPIPVDYPGHCVSCETPLIKQQKRDNSTVDCRPLFGHALVGPDASPG